MIDDAAFYISLTRDGEGESHCTIVLPRAGSQVRFGLAELDEVAGSLNAQITDAVRRAAPALPGGNRSGIMVKVPGAPEGLVTDGSTGAVPGPWDPSRGRFFDESSVSFDALMLCVEEGKHDWRFHAFAGQDRCTRCQVLGDGTYL
jgi:hypothetical protein